MNNSKTRVISLLLVIPLLLIFVMTSVVETTQIMVDIPVSSVKILGEKVVDIDIATQSNLYQIQTEITPKNATNQNVMLDASEGVPGQQKANVKITDDGKIVALSLGSVIITATAGNGRQDKIQLNFAMDAVSDVTAVTMQVPIKVGESINLTDGEYLSKRGTIDDATWTSDAPTIASVNDLGIVKGQSVGNTNVNGAIVGKHLNDQTGEVTNKTYNVTYNVDVTSVVDSQTGLAFSNSPVDPNGLRIKPTLDKATFLFDVSKDKLAEYGNLTTYLTADDEQGIASANITTLADGSFQLDVTLADTAQENVKYAVEIHSTGVAQPSNRRALAGQSQGEYITTVYVQKGYYTYAELQQDRQAMVVKSTSQNLLALVDDILPEASTIVNVTYKSSNTDVLAVQTIGKACRLTSKNTVGKASIWAEIKLLDQVITTKEVEVYVVDPAKSITFSENTEALGLENIKTIAGNVVEFATGFDKTNPATYHFYKQENNYTLVPTTYTLGVTAKKLGSGQNAEPDDIIWRSSDESIATVKDGIVTVVGNGEVQITATSAYNEMLKLDTPVLAKVTLRCQKDAIWADDYYHLMFAMEHTVGGQLASLPVVLRSDIMLAPALGDTAFTDYQNYMENYCTTTMQTTADATFYKDRGLYETDAKIRYCVNITNDIYGNGKYICGEYITNSKRITGYEVFRGPLDLVKIVSTAVDNVAQSAAVKAQDNVVFLVNTKDVTICNVELKGCADETLYGWSTEEKPEANLSNFDKVGTVLEVVEDGCNVVYSRVNNGRTVVRIFGKAYDEQLDPTKRSTLEQEQYIKDNMQSLRTQTLMSNCILENGREFILKLSSNQIIKNISSFDMAYTGVQIQSAASPALLGNYLQNYIGKFWSEESGYEVNHVKSGMYLGAEKHSQYANDVEQFYNDYVLTDVILRNSVLHQSGLFCVGFESRFAGIWLFGQDLLQFKLPEQGWAHVAGTSMPARLKLEGDVRFYDWKVLDNVNAETLIEVSDKFQYKQYLSLDIKEMVTKFQQTEIENGNDADLLYEYSGNVYINGATAFYGGGKNYNYIDASDVNDNFVPLKEYYVPMSYLPRPEFISAAGDDPFRFYLYNYNSTLNRAQQESDFADGSAFNWLYKKLDN